MLNKINSFFTKRQQYIFVATLNFVGMYLYAFGALPYSRLGLVICAVTVLILFPITQYTNLTIKSMKSSDFVAQSYAMVVLLPFCLNLGGALALLSFPNLGFITKLGGIGIIAIIAYLLCLILNIILVVFEKGETIPLFRVASTWVQILSVVIAIPIFSGFFKLPYDGFTQSLLVGLFSIFFTLFFLWVVDLDPEIPPINRGEQVNLSLIGGFVAFCLSISVSFIPTEAFLRALLCSSSMMSLQSYFHIHYKNLVTKKLVLEYAFVTLLFLIIVLIFHS